MIYRITACLFVLTVLNSGALCSADPQKAPPLGTRQEIEALRELWQGEPYRTALSHVDEWLAPSANVLFAPPDSPWALQMQGEQEQAQFALVKYIVTGQHSYADAAVTRFNDWIHAYGQRFAQAKPDTSAMRTSRQVQPQCMMYCVLSALDLLNDQQRAEAQRVLKLCVSALMQRGKTFNVLDYYAADFRNSNFNTDRIVAVGWFALAFPDDPDSNQWMEHALTELKWQLDNVFMPDGGWPEGTRYHGGVMRAILPFAFALRHARGIDLFAEPMLRKAIEFPIHVQSPRDRTVMDAALTPGVGDAEWENQWESPLAWGAKAYEKSDPEFAARLMWGWKRAGSPLFLEMSPGAPLACFLFVDSRIPAKDQPALKSEVLPFGMAVLRSGFDTDDEQYLLTTFATSRGKGGHPHLDRGAFSLYAFRTPLAVHPGVGEYDQTKRTWYSASRSQNLVQFDGKNVGDNGEVDAFFDSGDLAYLDMNLTASAPGEYHRRILRLDSECYLIWDAIRCKGKAQYNLHVLGKEKSGENSAAENSATENSAPVNSAPVNSTTGVRFECANNIDLEVNTLCPKEAQQKIDSDLFPVTFFRADASAGLPGSVAQVTPRWLKITPAKEETDIITLLRPLHRGSDSPANADRMTESAGKPTSAEIHTSRGIHKITFSDETGMTVDGKAMQNQK